MNNSENLCLITCNKLWKIIKFAVAHTVFVTCMRWACGLEHFLAIHLGLSGLYIIPNRSDLFAVRPTWILVTLNRTAINTHRPTEWEQKQFDQKRFFIVWPKFAISDPLTSIDHAVLLRLSFQRVRPRSLRQKCSKRQIQFVRMQICAKPKKARQAMENV